MNLHLPHPPRLTLATRITLARLLLVPVFVTATLYYIDSVHDGAPEVPWRWAALALFVLVAVSDALDGYVARRRNERTRLGTILDPLADKALLLSGLLLLSGPWARAFGTHIPLWYAVLVISRDLLLVVGTVIIHTVAGHTIVRPCLAGKAATFFQMALIVWVLAGGPRRGFIALVAAAALLTLLSAIQYIADGIRQLEPARAHEIRPPT